VTWYNKRHMAARLAGSLHFQHRASARRRRLIIALVVVVLLAACYFVLKPMIESKMAKKVPVATQPPVLSYSAKQAQDVNLVAGAVGQYAAANSALPQHLAVSNGSLVLCGSVCDPSAYEVGGFSLYQAADIKIVPYAATLTVPSQNDMYLVPGAKCGTDGRIGAVNTDPRSMVLLFASVNGTTTSPRCVVL